MSEPTEERWTRRPGHALGCMLVPSHDGRCEVHPEAPRPSRLALPHEGACGPACPPRCATVEEEEPDGAPCCADPECSGNPCTFPGYADNH